MGLGFGFGNILGRSPQKNESFDLGNNATGNRGRRLEVGPYYWVIGTADGGTYIDGPHGTEISARQFARQKFDEGRWKVVPLNTRDPNRAKQILRHQMAAGGRDINDAFSPIRESNSIVSTE